MPGRATMDNFMYKHEWAMAIGHAGLAFASAFCYAAAAACYAAMEAHVAGYTTWLHGGDHEDVFGAMVEAGATAFISASANYAIGQGLPISGVGVTPLTRVGNVLAHAALGCAMAEAGGGKCGAGALSAAITAGVDQINTGSFGGGMALAIVAGCVGSKAGGGSCGTGAASSAVIYLYNSQAVMADPGDVNVADSERAAVDGYNKAILDRESEMCMKCALDNPIEMIGKPIAGAAARSKYMDLLIMAGNSAADAASVAATIAKRANLAMTIVDVGKFYQCARQCVDLIKSRPPLMDYPN